MRCQVIVRLLQCDYIVRRERSDKIVIVCSISKVLNILQ
jgi:hypothetical protein